MIVIIYIFVKIGYPFINMKAFLSAAIFYLLSFNCYSQSIDLEKIILQLDTMADGLVKGHFKNNILAFEEVSMLLKLFLGPWVMLRL